MSDPSAAAKASEGPETLLDLKGLNCPLPVLRLAKAVRGAAPGTRFRVVATDPMAKLDIAHFCRSKGYTLLETSEEGGVLGFLVEAGAGGSGET